VFCGSVWSGFVGVGVCCVWDSLEWVFGGVGVWEILEWDWGVSLSVGQFGVGLREGVLYGEQFVVGLGE